VTHSGGEGLVPVVQSVRIEGHQGFLVVQPPDPARSSLVLWQAKMVCGSGGELVPLALQQRGGMLLQAKHRFAFRGTSAYGVAADATIVV